MENVQNYDSYINIPSSQTYRSNFFWCCLWTLLGLNGRCGRLVGSWANNPYTHMEGSTYTLRGRLLIKEYFFFYRGSTILYGFLRLVYYCCWKHWLEIPTYYLSLEFQYRMLKSVCYLRVLLNAAPTTENCNSKIAIVWFSDSECFWSRYNMYLNPLLSPTVNFESVATWWTASVV
jgi:hypothetical protein